VSGTSLAMAIDARCLASGVGTYAFNIVRQFRRLNAAVHLQVLTAADTAERFAPLCDQVSVLSAPVHSLREQFEVARAVSTRKLLHCTHYNAPLLWRGPLVVTIPDVTPLLDSAYHSSWKSRMFGGAMLRAIGRRADHIITVSEYSRARIAEKLGVSASKISVAYNGVSEAFRPMDRPLARGICAGQLGARRPFLLYVGNLRAHKNVEALLRAYAMCRQAYRIDHELVLIGGAAPMSSRLRELVVELGIGDGVHFVHFLDQSTLVAAYNAADMVVVPSLEEGFGLPVIEAMACGTPVACSDTSALPEIAEGAAAYFDPRDPADMASTIRAVLTAAEFRKDLRARGLQRAERFTWEQSARIHSDVYSQFLN
jgi:glycosyltransferase involved in cell wall biosynthesis